MMSRRRAEWILGGLGWSWAELSRRLNRLVGTSYRPQDTRKWGRSRPFPLAVEVYLRMAVKLALLERRAAGERQRQAADYRRVMRDLLAQKD
jgi:hypothetical protein